MSRFNVSRWLKNQQRAKDSQREQDPPVRKPKDKKPSHSVLK